MSHTSIAPTAIKIDQATKDRVKRLAEARDRTPHWLMKEAISQYLEREEQRETLKQDTLNAWVEYQETGLHATSDEVQSWLTTWGEENETPAPVCHK